MPSPRTSPAPSHPSLPHRRRALVAITLAAALFLASGSASAAPRRGQTPPERPAGLLKAAYAWLLARMAPEGGGHEPALLMAPSDDDRRSARPRGGGAAVPTTKAGGTMDPDG